MELKPGQDTATAVVEAIRANPRHHDQSDWAKPDREPEETSCGTKRCIAGWTMHVHSFSDTVINEMGGTLGLNGVFPPVAAAAANLLGIDDEDAYILFYFTNNEDALTATEWLACGKRLNWDEILGEDQAAQARHLWRRCIA